MVNNLVVCGGTFDHFHKGHEKFLNYALSMGRKIIIGLTSDEYLQNSKLPTSLKLRGTSKTQNAKLIESFEERRVSVSEFLRKEKALNKTEIIKIDDLFGPTLSKDLLIDAIIVSKDTKRNAEIINQERKRLGLSPLRILVGSSVLAEDGKLIASQRIRDGLIDREGRIYANPVWLKTGLVLPEDLRQKFKEPFGEMVENIERENEASCVVAVGDVTAKKFNENSVMQNVSVIDFKIARKVEFSSIFELGFSGNEEIIAVSNPAGHITAELFNAAVRIFKSDFKNRIILKVTGEDDLAVLPMVLASPLGTNIYYGQPGKGLMKIVVSVDSKDKAYNLASKFKPI